MHRLISESSQEPPFIILPGSCPATCQIGCPAPTCFIHVVSETRCREAWSYSICSDACLWHVSATDKTVKLWKISERDKRPEGYNLKDEDGRIRSPSTITSLRVRDHHKLLAPTQGLGCSGPGFPKILRNSSLGMVKMIKVHLICSVAVIIYMFPIYILILMHITV